ncbi:facilitated trehalose transporter Tret1-like [Macrosteles quadrilineatus]|uniref:facilitated trehalose transporter Tret1-like n=1 Tax=Macrosteles quadrilineatus TaxID=74068 RepID=UPI0023E26B6E|nr:facilitated trehalose transporter Tret1-like [Macrosteles quadrilineatus]
MFFSSPETRGNFRQAWSAITVNIGMMCGGEFFGWPSPALIKLRSPDSPIHLSVSEASIMVSIMYLGNIISPIPTGYLMDHIGRKKSLIICSILPVASLLLTYYARSVSHLIIARLLAGLWIGVITTVAPMYTGEIASPKIRGALGNLFSLNAYSGTLFIYIVGAFVSYKTLQLTAEIIPIYFFITLLTVPESPYFLLRHGNRHEAKKSLQWLRGGVSEEVLEREVTSVEDYISKQMENKHSVKDIFTSRSNRKAFLIVELYAIFVKFAGVNLIMAYSSVTLPSSAFKHFTLSECSIVLAATWFICGICSMFMVDRFGRKVLLTYSSLGCSFFLFVAGLWFLLNEKTRIEVEDYSWIPFVCFIFHGIIYALGLGPIGVSIKGELLPANIRASASAITTIVFALTSLLLNQIYLPVTNYAGMYVNYWIYAVSCLLCCIFTQCVFIETKGKTLQEIQEQLEGKHVRKEDHQHECRV